MGYTEIIYIYELRSIYDVPLGTFLIDTIIISFNSQFQTIYFVYKRKFSHTKSVIEILSPHIIHDKSFETRPNTLYIVLSDTG